MSPLLPIWCVSLTGSGPDVAVARYGLGYGDSDDVKPVLHIKSPSDAGPGERQEAFERAVAYFEQMEVAGTDVMRIDVPAGGTESDSGVLRSELEAVVPALQSGSLFGDRQGVEIVDAHRILAAEAEVIATLLDKLDGSSVVVVFLTEGALPKALAVSLKATAEMIEIKKMRERDAQAWLVSAARSRKIRLEPDAVKVLLQRFGSDVAALGQALDQFGAGEVSAEMVQGRFKNRPDAPMWHYSDALGAGDRALALRRLSDFLVHGHPLQLLAYLESELRWRSLAAAAPDRETFADWVGSKPDNFRVKKAWEGRQRVSESELGMALAALTRADRILKSAPEETHRVTLERLTVALARWYGGSARRAS